MSFMGLVCSVKMIGEQCGESLPPFVFDDLPSQVSRLEFNDISTILHIGGFISQVNDKTG